nr:hypothetical protein Itr_chr14CG24630 [Ipomoea trifida]
MIREPLLIIAGGRKGPTHQTGSLVYFPSASAPTGSISFTVLHNHPTLSKLPATIDPNTFDQESSPFAALMKAWRRETLNRQESGNAGIVNSPSSPAPRCGRSRQIDIKHVVP